MTREELKRFHSLTSDCFQMFRSAMENGFDDHDERINSIIAKYDTENNKPERCILVGFMRALLAIGGDKNA